MSAENIASIYIEAILDVRKLREQVKDLEREKFNVSVNLDGTKALDLRKQLENSFKDCIPVKFCVDDTQLNKFKNSVNQLDLRFPIEIDDRNIVKSINDLKKTVESTIFKPKVEFDNAPLVNQISQAIDKVNQNGNLSVNLKIKEGQNSRGEFKEISFGLKNIERAIGRNSNNRNIFTGFQEAIGANIFKQINLGVRDIFGKDIGSNFRQISKGVSKSFNKNVLENDDLLKANTEAQNLILGRIRKGIYHLGDGISDALDMTNASLVEKINVVTKKTFEGVDFQGVGKDISNELKDSLGKIFSSIVKNSNETFITKPIGDVISTYREIALQEKAIPLVRERALEVLNQKRSKNSAKLVDENTQELIIATGGYAGARGLSGERIAKELNKQGVEGRQAIWIKNQDSDIPKESMKNMTNKLQALLISLGKPNIRGYSKDALEIASQALAAKEINPNVEIKILGESGGGFAAEEASKILDLLGIKNQFLGVGTPNFIGGLDITQKRKILSPDEYLGAEVNKIWGNYGLANINQSQRVLGVKGHPYENYRDANVAELQNFFQGSPGKYTEEKKEQFNKGLEVFKSVDKDKLSSKELEDYTKGAYANLQYVRRFLLEATGETEKELQVLSKEFEDIYVELTPDSRDFSDLKSILKKAEEYLIALQSQPGIEASIVAKNISEDLNKLKGQLKQKINKSTGTEEIKYKNLLKNAEEIQKALNNPLIIGIKPVDIKPIKNEIEKTLQPRDVELKNNQQVSESIKNVEITQEEFEKIFEDKYDELKLIVDNYSETYKEFKKAISKGDKVLASQKGKEVLKYAKGVEGFINTTQKTLGLEGGIDTSSQVAKLGQLKSRVKRTVNEVNRKSTVQNIDVDVQPVNIKPLPNLKELGRNINEGLAQGYIDANEETIAIITEANKEIIKQTKKDFEIQSPSKVFQEIGEDIVKGLEKGLNNLENLSFDEVLKGLKDKFSSLAVDGLKFSTALYAIGKAVPFLKEFVSESLQVASQMETINRQVIFSAGGGTQGENVLKSLRKTAKDLRLDIKETLQSSSGFIASTEGTTLEGNIGLDTFQNFQKLFRAKGGDKDSQQRALLQLEQMAAIGQIQNVDLKQLSMAVPGVRGILARSQGLTPGELQGATRRGLGSDALIQFSQQAAIESESGISDSLDTMDARVQSLNNNIFELQEKIGNIFLPAQKAGFDAFSGVIQLLSDNIKGLITGFSVFAIKMSYPYLKPLVSQFLSFISTIDLTKIKLGDASNFIGNTFKTLKPAIAEALLVESLISGINNLRIIFSDLGGDISKVAKGGKDDINELKKSLDFKNVGKTLLPKNGFELFGRDFMENPLQVLNPFDSTLRERNKKVGDTLKATSRVLENSRELRGVSNNPKINSSISEITQIDKEINKVQTKRRATVQLRPQNTKEIQDLQNKEQELIKRRFEILKPVASLQGNLSKRIDDLKNAQKQLESFKDDGSITEDNYLAGTKEITKELGLLEKKQREINKSVGEAKNSFGLLRREILNLNTALEDTKNKIELVTTKSKINVLLNGGTRGNKEYLNQLVDIKSSETNLTLQKRNINQLESSFKSPDAKRTLDAYGVGENTGVNKINQILGNLENENDKFILEEFSKLQQAKLQFSQSQLSHLQLKEQLKNQLIEQTKQVNEYFTNISRQVQEANLELQRQTNTLKANSASSKIRKAIGYTEDSFLNSFVDSLIQDIEATNAILNEELNKKSKLLSNKNQLQDAVKQAGELSLSLPGGKIPSVPVELNFEGVDNNQNVKLLKDSFADTQNKVDDITQSTIGLDNSIKDNINSSSQVTEEFNKSFDNILKVTTETANTGSKVDEVKEKVSLVNSEISKTSDSTNKVTNETNILSQAWSGLVNWINQAMTATGLWFNKLIEGNEILKNLGNKFNEITQSIGSGLQTGVNNLQEAVQSDVNQVVGALGGNKYGIASPSTTQSLKQVLEGSVTRGQGFFGNRPRGNHASIDFDSTEGLGGLAQFNAMFPGKVTSLRQWADGTKDKESGKESNAIRVASKLPGSNENFYVDYGHYLRESAQVKEGQNINAGQRLGQLAKDDKWSSGGHLDVKIRIPNSIANQFKTTQVDSKSRNMSFVEVKEFMRWYQSKIATIPQQENTSNSKEPLRISTRETVGKSNNVNSQSIARNRGLQSLVVTDTKGKIISTFNPDKAPSSPASTIKLVVADVAQTRFKPDQQIKINQSAIGQYDEKKYKAGQSFSASELITRAIKDSDNTATNALIQALGGVKILTQLANQRGYKDTQINRLISVNSNARSNVSTANDTTSAAVRLLNSNNPLGKIAANAFRETRNFNYQGEVGGKIGNNSSVIGNVGLVNVGGKEYLVTGYADVDGNKKENRGLIRNATNDVVSQLSGAKNTSTPQSDTKPFNGNQPVKSGIKRGGNELTQAEYNRLTPEGKRLYELRNNPNIWAMADTVARAEGTDFRTNSKNFGYTMMIGNEHDNDLSRHPFAGNQGSRIRPPRHNSTASGRYQMMDFNYSRNRARQQFGSSNSDLSKIFQGENPGSFSPGVQDLYFIASLKSRGVLDEVLAGNFEGALNNRQIALHYASLQSGNSRSAHKGQGTPEGQLKNTIPFVQQRARFRKAGNENQTLSPQQLQNKVSQGLNLQVQSTKEQDELIKKQSEQEIQRQKDTLLRNQETQLANLRRNLQENKDTRLSTTRKTEDLRVNAQPIKSTSEEFMVKIQGINREYDDIITELTRKSETINRSLDKSKKLLSSGEVTGENKNLLEKKIKDDEKTLATIDKELSNVKKLRTQATTEAKRVFNREEFIRQQNITFEESSKQIGVLKAQLEGLQQLQQNNPLDERVGAIPGMQREIALLESNLELNQEIARIEERRFKKELTNTQADTQIQRQKEINQEKLKGIELTFSQADADAKLKRQSLELDKRSRFVESDNSILQERIKAIELQESRNPLSINPYEKLANQERVQISQLGLESERNIQSILEFANSIKLPEEMTRKLIQNVEELNNLKLENIKTEFENLRIETGIKRLENINERENTLADFNNKFAFSREQMEIDQYKNQGGSEFIANDRSRRLGRMQELVRYEQEQREFEIKTQRLRQSGYNIPDDSLTKIREDMEAIHNLNLDNINQQFKTFGETLNDIGKQSIKGLSSGIADFIQGTKSLNDVLDNFFNNILNSVLNMGIQSLLGGLMGGGGFLGGLFYDGGIVPSYARGGIHEGMRKERSESGRKPQLAIVHDGELIIPYKRTIQLAKNGLSPEVLLGRFADGGIVGDKEINSMVGRVNNEGGEIKVESTVINNVEYVTIDQFKQGIKQAAKAGADGGLSMVQSKMSGSVSWRNSVGLS